MVQVTVIRIFHIYRGKKNENENICIIIYRYKWKRFVDWLPVAAIRIFHLKTKLNTRIFMWICIYTNVCVYRYIASFTWNWRRGCVCVCKYAEKGERGWGGVERWKDEGLTYACVTHTWTMYMITHTCNTHLVHTCNAHTVDTCYTHLQHANSTHTCYTHIAHTHATHTCYTHMQHTHATTHTCNTHMLQYRMHMCAFVLQHTHATVQNAHVWLSLHVHPSHKHMHLLTPPWPLFFFVRRRGHGGVRRCMCVWEGCT